MKARCTLPKAIRRARNLSAGFSRPRVEPRPRFEPSPGDTIPVFTMEQGVELAFFLETGQASVPRIKVPEQTPGFWKDGVFVSPQGDAINADCKSTATGHLYSARNVEDHYWYAVDVRPEHIVWRKAPPDWRERQNNCDWTTLETARPEIAPWLRKDDA